MTSKVEILAIADQKLTNGQNLMRDGGYSDAYYLAGFAVELYLKAVCTQVENKDDLFTETNLELKAYKKYRSHDLDRLIDLAGLRNDLNHELITNKDLYDAWMLVVEDQLFAWKVDLRYSNLIDQESCEKYFEYIKTIVTWIKTKL